MSPRDPHPTGWLKISILADPILHEALTSFLFDMGCDGVVAEDFGDRTLRGYIHVPTDPEPIRSRIARYLQEIGEIFPDASPPLLRIDPIEGEDWDLAWRRFFRPTWATPDLLILPPWEPVPEKAPPHVIRMDPGPAFGTGNHPTTRMCLRAMERSPRPALWTLLDVGTGSGILAVYGVRLGAGKVLAIDTDPEALRWAGRNLDLNEAGQVVRLSQEPVEHVRETFSLVCANLMLGEILRLMPVFPNLVVRDGRLILSGVLENQIPDVLQSLSGHGMHGLEILHDGEWACVVGVKARRGEVSGKAGDH